MMITWHSLQMREHTARIENAVGNTRNAFWYISKQSTFGKLMWSWVSVVNTTRADIMGMQVNWMALLADDIEYAVASGDFSLKRMARRLVLERALTETQFYTNRFELGIGVDLHKAGIRFKKSESPDYDLGGSIGLECTSTRFSLPSGDWSQVGPKIEKTVRGKAMMPYASASLALLVDISPMLAVVSGEGVRMDKEFIGNWISRGGGSAYGAVLIFSTMISFDTGMVGRNYLRFNQTGISNSLLNILNRVTPVSPQPIAHTQFLIPPEKYKI